MKTTQGTFDIKTTPLETDNALKAMNAIRMLFEKRFYGALIGNSSVSMIGVMDKNVGSGGYVALEHFEGELEGKKGSFILQHSSFMNKGRDSQTIAVVPDSGTAELTGLRGHMKIEIKDGQHYYTFDYEV